MTRAAAGDDRARLMRAVHATCRALGLDGDARRDVQLHVTGKGSMRDMEEGDLARLLAHLDRRRARAIWRAGRPKAARADLRLIHALWGELGRRGALARPGRAGLNAFIRARFGGHWECVPIDVDALTDTPRITDVIRALRAMLARSEKTGETGK